MRRVHNNLHLFCTLIFVFTLVLSFCFPQVNVGAQSEESADIQRRLTATGNAYFDPDSLASECGGVQLSGNNNEERVWNYLVSPEGMGFTALQAAGSMGNLKHEGNFNPRIVEGGTWGGQDWPPEMDTIPPPVGPQGQPGYGIVQWTSPGRKQGLQDLANQRSLPVHDLGLQLDYMKQELESDYYRTRALEPLRAATDLAEATRIWQENYEVGRGFAPRFEAAQDYLARFGSGAPTTADGPTSCGAGSGTVVGGLSLPLDRRWYDEHREWFTKTHHDYPAADIPVPEGTNVYSMTGGTIVNAPNDPADSGCGLGVTIDAGNGFIFTYCHGSDGGAVEGAQQGATVRPGQLIMHSANTGTSTGPHLHVQIEYNGNNLCPQTLFVGIADGEPPDLGSLPTSGCSH